MKKYTGILLLGGFLFGAAGCDLLDPTNTENPGLTEENVLRTPKPMTAWVRGLDRQAAVALNDVVVNAELTSDNYVNTSTYYDQELDALEINVANSAIEDVLFTLSDLRESAVYGRTTVAEADSQHTPNQLAEVLFYEALAHTFLGELFRLAPMEGGGVPVGPAEHFNRAKAALTEALQLSTDAERETGYQILLARVNRDLGDKAAAVAAAQAALAADDEYVRLTEYDAVNGPTNTMQEALFDRGDFDDLQPLPRLDFLDPKYFGTGSFHAPIPLVKAEEARLILAEAALADGQVEQAKTQMTALLGLVADRPVETVNDAAEDRIEGDPGSRPSTTDWKIRASAQDPAREGLVLDRQAGEVAVPTVSGTSVTAAMVNAVASVDQAVELVYLLRQEIFFAEGRRMADLGIKWVLPERELLNNENVQEGDATTPLIPAFFASIRNELDAFTVDAATKTATITHNVNRILAQNRAAAEVVPFF